MLSSDTVMQSAVLVLVCKWRTVNNWRWWCEFIVMTAHLASMSRHFSSLTCCLMSRHRASSVTVLFATSKQEILSPAGKVDDQLEGAHQSTYCTYLLTQAISSAVSHLADTKVNPREAFL